MMVVVTCFSFHYGEVLSSLTVSGGRKEVGDKIWEEGVMLN